TQPRYRLAREPRYRRLTDSWIAHVDLARITCGLADVRASTRDESFQRFGQPRIGGAYLQVHRDAVRRGDVELVPGRRNVCENRGERARSRRFPDSTDFAADERASDGITHHGGRGETRERGPHHGGDPVFRLCAPGPQR